MTAAGRLLQFAQCGRPPDHAVVLP